MKLLFACCLLALLTGCGVDEQGRFVRLSPDNTNISFTNTIDENDSINIFDFANVYNGGGVGVGDFNNDGLSDLYFTGNMVSNQLYLNRGKMKFEDVTRPSNTGGEGVWSRGVAVVDINNDGLMDLYVCATAKPHPDDRKNILYVNQGPDKKGIPIFKNMAAEYGIADTSQSTMAYFFDYDNDGDLDLFIAVNHIIKDEYANVFKRRNLNGEHPSTSRLYRNDYSESLKHPVYTEVSREAGILVEGYTHAANIFDINNDGWMDILETNDYISSNVLYINQRNGTFRDSVMQYFKHSAANSMGSDAIDINSDGLDDVIEVDMAAQDNLRKKMFQAPSTYQTYQNSDQFGYQYQYVRNMIQVNQGATVGQQDSIGHPVFSDLGYYCGIAETDWSWTPLVADFDNDGNRDIIFTNGFPKDITDRDFMMYRNKAINLTPEKEMLDQIPAVKIHNYVYRNNGKLSFTDKTKQWGLDDPSFSNGAAYADLDNDGDLDVIINNIGSKADVYENRVASETVKPHHLSIGFKGDSKNIKGIGARVQLHFNNGVTEALTNMPYRGYISSVQQQLHFGLGKTTMVDSLLVRWPDGKQQLLRNVPAGTTLVLDYKNAVQPLPVAGSALATNTLFTNVTNILHAGPVHQEDDFVDFNVQKLIPHKLSDLGPGIAVGDLNKDGLQDLVIGGSIGYSTIALMQQPDGRFSKKLFTENANRVNKSWHDMGMLLFDADNDGDPDLYAAAGGNETEAGSPVYQDNFYLNDGKGNFSRDTLAFPLNHTSKSCVRAADIDNDGDLDLFVAGRCVPWMFPKQTSCFIYRNDSKDGQVRFTDITSSAAKELDNIGMTCDALFTDYDNDGWPDLVLTGEFMPVRFFHNENGKFVPVTTGLESQTGWWNALIAGDFDNDGDIDYIAGNNGRNSFFRPTPGHPVRVYGKDFDNNNSYDALMSTYLMTSQTDTTLREYPASTRDDIIKQMIEMRNKFKTYKDYAAATVDQLFSPEQMKDAVVLDAALFSTSYIRNDGNGKFSMTPMPDALQFSSVFGMLAEDVNDDGNLDLIVSGNDYGTEVAVGRNDASNGMVLLGDGKGGFKPLTILQSGIYIPGNGKALVKIAGPNNTVLFAASQNRGPLQVFRVKSATTAIAVLPGETSASIYYRDGRKRKEEVYYGSGYLSASARVVLVNSQVQKIEFSGAGGKSRIMTF
ncbi:MAG: RNA-binding protein [Chitinophagaceae bacterium]|nr:MAG: RNA-binding protein [Chitinophagaceae bacterium]